MDWLKRTKKIIELLRNKQLNCHEIKALLSMEMKSVSLRQIQRDLKEISAFLLPNEDLNISKEKKGVYYAILKKSPNLLKEEVNESAVLLTKFYSQIITEDIQKRVDTITMAIKTTNYSRYSK